MHNYTEKRLRELRDMPTEDVAKCKIRFSTPPRVKAVILQAREKVGGTYKKPNPRGLKNGDVLMMRDNGTFSSRFISAVTGSPYTHAAVYSNGKIYDSLNSAGGSKKQGGNINTFDEFVKRDKGIVYDVFRPKEKKAAREAARNANFVTQHTKGYSVANAVQAGMRDRLGVGITANYDKNYKICSELVYDCFNGRIGNEASSSISPGRLAKNPHLEKVHTIKLSIEELFR